MSVIKQTSPKDTLVLGKQRSYSEVVEFFDKHWGTNRDGKSVERMKCLDALFAHASKKIPTILIGGTNGKSLTAHFAAKLLQKEGLNVGVFYAPHFLVYNERFVLNNETISNKHFTDLANEVITAAENAGIKANTYELITQIALNYFVENKVDVAILEVSEGGASNPVSICSPKIFAITRISGEGTDNSGLASEKVLKEYFGVVKKGTHFISADQNKVHLKTMAEWTKKSEAIWTMPIRKIVPLEYPFEQLHGRCAALAERIASIFVNSFVNKNALVVSESILAKTKGQRGRPTLEAKRHSELNPKQTIENFWKDTISELPGRFQILDKEKPTILLDNAHNVDAFENLFLGIRLLHYQRPLKGLTLVIGCHKNSIEPETFAKLVRYFFKKTIGQIVLCPLRAPLQENSESWDVEKVNNALKAVKVKARVAHSFKEAFEIAKKSVNDRHGLVVIAGSSSIVSEYWNYKGIKKV